MERFFISTIAFIFFGVTNAQVPDAEFVINEELKLTTVVGNVSSLPTLFPGMSGEDRQSLQYGILNQVTEPASLFNITNNGVLYVAKRIDREQLCLGIEKCVLKLNILVSSPSQFDSSVITVFFIVNDINDNAPEFDNIDVVLEITEGNALNSVLKITGANDRDFKERFKTQNYSLDAFNNVFELTASQTLDGSSEIDLKLLKSLNREEKDRYDFSITASDGGSPPLSAILQVSVIVTDKNDNPPEFLNSSYSAVIDGETGVNSFVLQVSATDKDIGVNGKISYDFSSLQKPMLKNNFKIDSQSGEIFTMGSLSSSVFNFIVEAQDSGSPSLKAQTEVSVTVINTGNAPPSVSITTLGTNMEDNTIPVMEPGGRGVFVAFIDVSDDAGGVVCDISDGAFKMEPIPNKGYKLSLQGQVDRESKAIYNLSVTCVDAGEPPLQSKVQFFVKILDDNDNPPKFSQQRYSRTLTEGKKNGEYVLQVSASDRDIGINSKVRYTIDPNFRHQFIIHPTTGILTAVGELDRESSSVITFNVYATDQGKPPLQSKAEISIFLEDINDNEPEFTKKIFRFRAREEVKGFRIINKLSASDKDQGVNGQLEYFFTGSTDGADSKFHVQKNGTIVTTQRLDREDKDNYTFSVMVRDKGNPPLMSSARVIVEITDINDNTPEILFPDTKIHRIPISTVPEKGGLTLVSAHDNDAGENGSLKFTIVAGNEDGAFAINQNNGEFSIAKASRVKNHKTYNVDIVVSDRGSPPKANTTTLVIEVNYKNITRLQQEQEEDYIVIVAVVAAITVVFSSIIIAAICVVFQKDRNSRRNKSSFHNIHTHSNLSDDDKIIVHSDSNTDAPRSPFPLNDLSGLQQNFKLYPNSQNSTNNAFLQTKFSFSDNQSQNINSTPKGKAVSFSLETENGDKNKSNVSNKMPFCSTPNFMRDAPPSMSTFGSSRVRPSDADEVFRQHSQGIRQVSGVRYTPVCTNGQVDDVTSDTSADTATSDSGRGNSVDDVTFENVMKDDLPSMIISNTRTNEEPAIPPRKMFRPGERPTHHVTFSASCDQINPTHSSSPTTQSNIHKYYSGGRSSKDSNYPSKDISNSKSPRNSGHFPFQNSTVRLQSSNVHAPKDNVLSKSRPSSNQNLHKLSTFANHSSRQHSLNSIDDDVSTTTSGSYVIDPEDIKMETYVGSDVVV